MAKTDEEQILKKIIKFAKKEKALTEAVENEFLAYFGDKGSKIVEVLRNNKLHKIRVNNKIYFWMVEGKDKNYLILDNNYCECYDFQIRVLMRKERQYCYHLMAKIVGESLKLYDTRVLSEEKYEQLLKERAIENTIEK